MNDYNDLIRQLGKLATEQVNPDTIDIDRLSPLEIVRKINSEDRKVADVVASTLEPLSRVAQFFADTLMAGGRVFYVGAGTSGRLGVLDAAECPPTFGTDPDRIIGIISGGHDTLVLSREGVEDDVDAAVADLKTHGVSGDDLVIGLAASTRTPYTNAALQYARSTGARTAFIICNANDELTTEVDELIALPVGPEVVTGSTRMKSGTAQKMALNIISTTAMVLMGKTYGNLMVDLQARSDKLHARSRMMLMKLLGLELAKADDLLDAANGSVKTAIVMYKLGCNKDQATRRLDEVGGRLYRLIE
jgi:N-acetylmuramic acid 6-phosphate etherase